MQSVADARAVAPPDSTRVAKAATVAGWITGGLAALVPWQS